MLSRVLKFMGSSSDNAANRHQADAAVLDQALFVGCLFSLFMLTGCSKSESRVPVTPVSGKVAPYHGQVPAGAFVSLRRTDGEGSADVVPSGTVKDDGTFVIGSYETGDGAPPGDYVATITWFKVIDSGPGPNVLPVKYSNADTSPIKVNVGASATEIPAITINK